MSWQIKTLLGVRSFEVRTDPTEIRGELDELTRVTKGRSIQNIPRVLGDKVRGNRQILIEEYQIILVRIHTGKHGIMGEIALNRLPKSLSPLDFFVGNCSKILFWVAPLK